ncbi:hypothetical protein [Arthrobacter roseus]|uniref:hypothetical protein n=1 Tax=Arthrobacter roseus TaxID=136274 RepID=UPI0019647A02
MKEHNNELRTHLHRRSAYGEAVTRTREVLSDQGFGVLPEIDVRATFEAKLGSDAGQVFHGGISLPIRVVEARVEASRPQQR